MPMLVVGSPKCKAFMETQSVDQTNPQFGHVLNAGVSHLNALMAVYSWQVAQGRSLLHEYLHHKWSWNVKEMLSLTKCLEFK